MPKRLVVVTGNIGVGKTSLTERIGSRLGWRAGYESVADNPYLLDFYADMRAWSFHLRIFSLAVVLTNISMQSVTRGRPSLIGAFMKKPIFSHGLCTI